MALRTPGKFLVHEYFLLKMELPACFISPKTYYFILAAGLANLFLRHP
jgi:hypothetical protein